MKKSSSSLVIREMQIKTTLDTISCQLEWWSLKSQETTVAGEDVEKYKCFYTVGGSVNQFNHCGKTVWWFLKDVKPEIPFDPAIPLLGMYLKDYKSFYRDTHTHVLYCSTTHNSKNLEPTQMPINDSLDIENVAHIHHGILCSYKKEWVNVLFRAWMKLETIIFSKLPQEQKNKHYMFSLISGSWTMRTHGHREGTITHHGLLGGEGARGGRTLGEMPNVDDGLVGAANHHGACIPK